MSGLAALLPLPAARLAAARRGWIAPLAWTAVVAASAIAARPHGGAAVDRVLLGTYAAFALPLAVLGVVAVVLGGEGLPRAGAPLVRFGASPTSAALAHAVVATAASAAVGAALGAVAVLLARGPEGAPLAGELAGTAYAGALGGAAYASLFLFGASFGAKGGGRGVAFVADFVLGGGDGTGALLVPRAHVRRLLGDFGDLPLTPRASGAALAGIVVAFALAAALRARRAAA